MYCEKKIGCRQGFTIVELVVVAVIMAIIVAIAVPLYKGHLVDSYAPEGEAVLSAISTAAQRYRLMNGTFANMNLNAPTDADSLLRYGLDINTTDKWTFNITSAGASSFTAVATGNGTAVSALSGKTITLTYNLAATPHESKQYYNF